MSAAVLRDIVLAHAQGAGLGGGFHATAIDGLLLLRSDHETAPHRVLYQPAICLNVQGAKQVLLADSVLDYAAGQYLVVSVDLPIAGRVTRAGPGEPFLAMLLDIDVDLLREVMEQLPALPSQRGDPGAGVLVGEFSQPMIDCALRLMRLLETPQAIPVLHPAILRELYYWLLTGPEGAVFRHLALPDSHTRRIGRAIQLMRQEFAATVRVEQLAALASMSLSSFHQHFKAITSMSPLQFQKQLRLLEARRLMMAEADSAAHVAHRVGYESASQFSREYARMFGAPPRRDVTELRATAL